MRLPFWIASKNLASRRLHAACAILGIAFGVATVVAIQIVDANTVAGVREHHRRFTGDPDWVLTVHDPRTVDPAQAIAVLRNEPGFSKMTPVLTDRVTITASGKKVGGIPFFAMDPGSSESFDSHGIGRGRDLNPEDRSGVFLAGPKIAKDAKLQVGRKYRLQRPSSTPHGCADGQLVPIASATSKPGPVVELELVGVLEDRHLGRANGGRAIVVPYDDGLRLMASTPFLARYWVKIADGVSRSAISDRLAGKFRIEVPEAREVGETREERAFRSGVRLASFTALGLGLFIIFHLLTLAVTSWVRQVGLLGALGVTGRTVARVFVIEALLLAVLGTAAGIGIGIGIAKLMLAARLTTLGWGRPVLTFDIPWDTLAWVAGAGIAACLLGAIQPIARVRRVPIIDALTQGEAAIGAAPAPRWIVPGTLAVTPAATLGLAWLLHPMDEEFLEVSFLVALVFGAFVVALWTLPGVLGRALGMLVRPFERPDRAEAYLVRKGLTRGLRRFAGSVTGLSLVAAGIVTLHAITGALKADKDDWAERALPGHVFVELPRVPRARLDALASIEGVTSLVPVDAVFRQGTIEIRGVPVEALRKQGLFATPEEATRLSRFSSGVGIVVTTNLAREQKLRVGDQVPFTTFKGRRSFEVLAIDDRFGFRPHQRSYALVNEVTAHQVFCRSNDHVTFLSVGVDDPSEEDAVAADIRSALTSRLDRFRVWTGAQQRQMYRDEINNDFALFDVILLLTAILAGMGLLNSLLVSGLERTRETGLLRAIGTTRKQIFRLFLSESALLGVASGILGSAIGTALSIVAVEGLAALSGLPLVYRFEPIWVLVAVLILVTFAALASLIPASRAGRADVIAAIKYE